MHRGFVVVRVVLVLLCCVVSGSAADAADSAQLAIDSVEIGVKGIARPGAWTEAIVRFDADSPVACQVHIEADDPRGSPAVYQSAETQLTPGDGRIRCFFMPGRLEQTVRVRVISSADGTVLASTRLRGAQPGTQPRDFTLVRHETPVWAVVGRIGSETSPAGRTAAGRTAAGKTTAGKTTGGEADDGQTAAERTAAERRSPARKELLERGIQLAQFDPGGGFPDHVRALSAVDVVILSGEFDFDPDQAAALREWTRLGGHLVVGCGTRAAELTASSISDWVLEGSVLVPSALSDVSGLEAFATSTFRIPVMARLRGSIIKANDGIDLVSGIDGALVTRSAHGFGRITLIGVDLDRPPLSRWRSLDSFVAVAADLKSPEIVTEDRGQRISRTGITELATQFHSGLESIPQIGERSTLSVLGLILLFLVLIGPLDYLLVHRVLKKPGLTWLTFPVVVLAAGFLATAAAKNANGTQPRSAICDVLDLDASSGFVRQTAWSTVYSPNHRRYAVDLIHSAETQLARAGSGNSPAAGTAAPVSPIESPAAEAAAAVEEDSASENDSATGSDAAPESQPAKETRPNDEVAAAGKVEAKGRVAAGGVAARGDVAARSWLGWSAIPESNFGGLYRAAGMGLGEPAYRFLEQQTGIANLPVAAASDRVLKSDAAWAVPSSLFETDLTRAGTGHLSRDSSFTHHLPAAIDDWVLVYGNRAYFHKFQGGDMLGSSAIEPGDRWLSTGETTGGRELRSFLTGSTFQRTEETSPTSAGDEFEFAQVKWDPKETDLLGILRMITFHDVAGGHSYTGLSNAELHELELSDSLPLDRAVLIGRLTLPTSTLKLDGQPVEPDRRETFIRVLLPVSDAVVDRALPKFEDD